MAKQSVAIVVNNLLKIGGAEILAIRTFFALRNLYKVYLLFKNIDYNSYPYLKNEKCVFSYKFAFQRLTNFLGKDFNNFIYSYNLFRIVKKLDIQKCISFSPDAFYVTSGIKKFYDKFYHIWYCQEPPRSAYYECTDRFLLSAIRKGKNVPFEFQRYHKLRMRRLTSSKNRKIRKRISKSLKSVDLIVANSFYTKESIKLAFNREAEVIYPLIEQFEKCPSFAFKKNSYIGIISPKRTEKNLYMAIRAIKYIKDNYNRKIPLKIAGWGKIEQIEKLKQFVIENNLEDFIEIKGYLKKEEQIKFIKDSAFMMYIPIDEPFGMVPFECLFLKKPVIISNHGGMSELLKNEIHAIKVNPLDIRDIAMAILKLYDNSNLQEKISTNGYKLVKEKFTKEHYIKNWQKILKK